MWVFLITEIMFFGGMFLAYTVYRAVYPARLRRWPASTLNAIIGAVEHRRAAVQQLHHGAGGARARSWGSASAIMMFLILTLVLGLVFLGVKGFEWNEKFQEHHVPGPTFHLEGTAQQGHAQLFFSLYFAMTGLHALHMVIGVRHHAVPAHGDLSRGDSAPDYYTPIDMGGLYWHFVDIIWIFLFPLLYLIDRHLKMTMTDTSIP